MNNSLRKSLMFFFAPLASILLMGVLVWDIAKTLDSEIENERSQFVNAILASELEDANIIAREFTLWDEAIEKIIIENDRDWADQNTGSYLIDSYQLDATFVLTPDNQEMMRFDVEEGERPSITIPLHTQPAVLELADKARQFTPALFNAASDWISIEGELFLLSASAFTYEAGLEEKITTRKPEEMYVLILVKRAGAAYWTAMAKRLGLPTLSSDKTQADGLRVPLRNSKAQQVGVITVPGRTDVIQAIFMRYGVGVALVTSLLIAMVLFTIKQSKNYKIERDKVIELNANMDKLVKERTQDLEVALIDAQKASRAKSTFLSAMSHEFRTPLNAILGFTQLLIMKNSNFNDKENSWIGQIDSAGQHLLGLVNDVLDLARVENGKIELDLEALQPREVFKECYQIVSPMAAKENLRIEGVPKTDHYILVDRFRLKQVILNIMNNAVKYNVENGSITFGCFDLNNGKVRLYIEDTGIGISKEDQQHIFDPFFRSNSVAQLKEGTGVGLSLVVQLTQAMGGEVSFKSELGQGTSFYLDFPIHIPTELIP